MEAVVINISKKVKNENKMEWKLIKISIKRQDIYYYNSFFNKI
jgi:hypothetical protein